MGRVDFHTHILPGIDDGSENKQQSYEMLQEEMKHGVQTIIATPHFYPDGPSVTKFIQNRHLAYKEMKQYILKMSDMSLPDIRLGAEVLLATETAYLENLKELAIEGTKYILIEMPYDDWQEWVYESIERIYSVQGLIPVIAHIERYIPMQKDTGQIYRLLSIPKVLGQMNTRSLLDAKRKHLCYRLIKSKMVHVLGSDAHRSRHLVQGEIAYNKLIKKFSKDLLVKLEQQANILLDNGNIDKQTPRPFNKLFLNYYK